MFRLPTTLALAATLLGSACAQTPDADQQALDAVLAETPLFSGTVVVMHDNHVTAEAYIGLANRETGRANAPDTLFSMGSIGKMITAYAVDALIQSGSLDFDTPVRDVLTELDLPATLTVDHLLRHRSGLSLASEPSDALLETLTDTHARYVAFQALGLSSEGPAPFRYNNLNYLLLGEIIARRSGRPYETFIAELATHDNVVPPLRFDRDAVLAEGQDARPYMPVDFDTWWNSETTIHGESAAAYTFEAPLGHPSAGGGAYVTARDLAQFLSDIEAAGAVDRLCFIVTPEDRPAYGRGCSVRLEPGARRFGHTGSTAGVQARAFAYPDRGYEIVILSNHDGEAAPVLSALEDTLGLRPE